MPKLCQFENCRKRASYALTYGKPDRCKEHKENRRPQYNICRGVGCNTHPVYNYDGQSKALYCKEGAKAANLAA